MAGAGRVFPKPSPDLPVSARRNPASVLSRDARAAKGAGRGARARAGVVRKSGINPAGQRPHLMSESSDAGNQNFSQ